MSSFEEETSSVGAMRVTCVFCVPHVQVTGLFLHYAQVSV